MLERRDFFSPEYKRWRAAVYRRDHYRCVMCVGKNSGKLNAHHIKRWADYPQLRFDVNNGVTLCKKHHQQVTGHETHYELMFRAIVQKCSLAKDKKITVNIKQKLYERMKKKK